MSTLSNESSFHYMCAEVTLLFSAIVQRFNSKLLNSSRTIYGRMPLRSEIVLYRWNWKEFAKLE